MPVFLDFIKLLESKRLNLKPLCGRQLLQLLCYAIHQRFCSRRCSRRYLIKRQTLFLYKAPELGYLLLGRHITFVRRDYLRSYRQLLGEIGKLQIYLFKVLTGIAPLYARNIHHMNYQPTAFNVP